MFNNRNQLYPPIQKAPDFSFDNRFVIVPCPNNIAEPKKIPKPSPIIKPPKSISILQNKAIRKHPVEIIKHIKVEEKDKPIPIEKDSSIREINGHIIKLPSKIKVGRESLKLKRVQEKLKIQTKSIRDRIIKMKSS